MPSFTVYTSREAAAALLKDAVWVFCRIESRNVIPESTTESDAIKRMRTGGSKYNINIWLVNTVNITILCNKQFVKLLFCAHNIKNSSHSARSILTNNWWVVVYPRHKSSRHTWLRILYCLIFVSWTRVHNLKRSTFFDRTILR